MGLAAENPVRVAVAAWRWARTLGADGQTKGIRAKTSSFHRFHSNTLMSKAKTVGNYVNSILASHEARSRAASRKRSCSTPRASSRKAAGENIFVVRDGVVKTPGGHSILPGITRDSVIRLLADGASRCARSASRATRSTSPTRPS